MDAGIMSLKYDQKPELDNTKSLLYNKLIQLMHNLV